PRRLETWKFSGLEPFAFAENQLGLRLTAFTPQVAGRRFLNPELAPSVADNLKAGLFVFRLTREALNQILLTMFSKDKIIKAVGKSIPPESFDLMQIPMINEQGGI